MKKKILLMIGLCLIFLAACSPSEKQEEPKGTEQQDNNKDVKNEEEKAPQEDNNPEEKANNESEPVGEEAKPEEPEQTAEPEEPTEAEKPEEPEVSDNNKLVNKDFDVLGYMSMLKKNEDNTQYTYKKDTKINMLNGKIKQNSEGKEEAVYDGKIQHISTKNTNEDKEVISNVYQDVSGEETITYIHFIANGEETIDKIPTKAKAQPVGLTLDPQLTHLIEKYPFKYDEAQSNGNILAFTKLIEDAGIDEFSSGGGVDYTKSKGHIKQTIFMNADKGQIDSFVSDIEFTSEVKVVEELTTTGMETGKYEIKNYAKSYDFNFENVPKVTIPENIIKKTEKAN